jgi:DNA-binding NarL/FixJ family response regulator
VLFRLRQHAAQTALAEREVEILRLVAAGRKTQEIARSVHLTERMVKHYMELICEKLGCRKPQPRGGARRPAAFDPDRR